jgi:hypothetical protein
MPNKGHNAKKPKLAEHAAGKAHDAIAAMSPGEVGANPEKHKMSFAQHQHEQVAEHTATPLPEAPARHLKSDVQQHQQVPFAHK